MALGVLALLGSVFGSAARTQSTAAACPAVPTAAISPAIPSDVCIPDGFKDIAVEYFDDYSWHLFVGLV